MKTKKKRDKKYRPRPAEPGGGLVAIAKAYERGEDAAPLRQDQAVDLGATYWMAFENLRAGSASEESWSFIAYALNMAVVLAEQGIGTEHEADLVRALDGTFRAKVRSEKTQNYRLDGEAMTDIKHALQVHDAQMEIATRAEILKARDTILKRLNEGKVYMAAPT